ncbi:methionyl-tRNA formyltransferase [soil metagenome]
MNVAFAGTPEFAAIVLRGLLDSEHTVGLVTSQPDARRGRGRKTSASPVAELAVSEEIPLLRPNRIEEIASEVRNYDALVVAAYGQILRADTLYATERGAWNVHASLLPAYRGAAPVERAIMNGEVKSGVSIMLMREGLDTGPVALRKEISIEPQVNGDELTVNLAKLGAKAIVETLSLVERNAYTLTEQDETLASYAPKLAPEDRVIRWNRPAKSVHDQVRGLAPEIGARTFHPAFEGPIKLLRTKVEDEIVVAGDKTPGGTILAAKDRILVQCGKGILQVDKLQVPGGKPVAAEEFLRGNILEGTLTESQE